MQGTGPLRNEWWVLSLSAAVIVVDQATKLLVKGFSLSFLHIHHVGMALGTSVPLIGDAVRITYIENPGMAFGLQVGSQLVLALFSLGASVGICYYLVATRGQKTVVRVSLALILGGAAGNLIDRTFYGVAFGDGPLFYGKVVDFIDVNLLHLSRFGIFNIADAAVTVGVILLLVFHRSLEQELDEPDRAVATGVDAAEITGSPGNEATTTHELAGNFPKSMD